MKDLKVEVKDNTTPDIYTNGNLLISDEGLIVIVTSNIWDSNIEKNKFKGTVLNDIQCTSGHFTPGSNHEWLKGHYKQFYGEVNLSIKDPSVVPKRMICPSAFYALCSKVDTEVDNVLTCLDRAVAKVKADFINCYNLGLVKSETKVQLKVYIETDRTDIELTELQKEEAERACDELYRKYINEK